jgi:hypothetical protein
MRDQRNTPGETEREWTRALTGAYRIVNAQPAGTHCPSDWTVPTQRQPAAGVPLTGGIWDYAIDWATLLAGTPPDPAWLINGLIEQGRLVAIYSRAKAGKSLVTLDMAASIALGKPCLGTPPAPPRHVLYCDYEMTQDEIAERIRAYGHDQPANLNTHLHYLSLPMIPPLDTEAGGQILTQAAQESEASLVIVDTTSRTISGKENDSDTWHAWYRHTGLPLKSAGCAVIRLDHAGKDDERGQRGSSAKVSDVDLVLRLTRPDEHTIILKREEARQSHYREQTTISVILDGNITTHRLVHDPDTATIILAMITEANRHHYPRNVERARWHGLARDLRLSASRQQIDDAHAVWQTI